MAYTTRQLIERAQDILNTEFHVPERGIIMPSYVSGPKYNKWVNDLLIKLDSLQDNCPLKKELNQNGLVRNDSANSFKRLIGLLESLEEWEEDIMVTATTKNSTGKEYDIFLSHANADKEDYVDELYKTLRLLKIRIFYDKESLSWGDNWKNKIEEGLQKSEFGIIIISNNFFDREWTEKELVELLNRQNEKNQKIVLPLLHNISFDDLKKHYPQLGNIQALETNKVSKERIALEFASLLIKRIRE